MKKAMQMSESIELAIFLALSGGLMDAYSYLLRGQVFANAQTGNMLLLGVHASQGNWAMCLKYVFPISFFALGIFYRIYLEKKIILNYIGDKMPLFLRYFYLFVWLLFLKI